jgi:preprotein translocase subunit SecG
MLYYAVVVLYVLICFLLLVVVLLQQGKGGDIAAAFGGSSSQTAFGARAGATVLTRATTVLASLFMIGSFALGVLSRSAGGGSVVSGVDAPAATQPAAPTLPTGAAPAPTTPPATAPAPGGDKGTPPATPPVETGKATPPAGKKKGDK